MATNIAPKSHDTENSTSFFKNKSNLVWLAIIILVVLGGLMIWGSNARSKTPDNATVVKITDDEKSQLKTTVTKFIETAGNFGFDWGVVDDPVKNTYVQNVRDQWIASLDNGPMISPEVAQAITNRDTIMFSLTQPYDGEHSLMSTSDGLYNKSFEYAELSDAFYASQFSVKAPSIRINWKNTKITKMNNDRKQAVVSVSWDSQWKRATVIPQDNGSGKDILKANAWEPRSMTEEFKGVKFTLMATPDGKHWQVTGIRDGGNNDWNKYSWMLAVGLDAKYDENGKIVTSAGPSGGNTNTESTEQ